MVGAVVLAVSLGALWLALVLVLPSDEALAVRAAGELQRRLGVPVTLGALHWRLLPVPVVALQDAATRQPQPIQIKKLTIYPNLAALLDGRFKVDRMEVDGAVVPQLSLRALDQGLRASGPGTTATPLERFVFRDLRWIARYGIAVVYDGEIDFDPNWRPRQAQLRRPDFKPATDLSLTRQGQEDRWVTRINVGGGTAHGEVRLQARAKGRLYLDGKLQPRGIEVASALAAFNRRSIIAGKASGNTTLSANGDTAGELAQSLHSKTTFTMSRATLLRFDLDKAIHSAGKEHAGQTPLDSVSGQLDTQNTPQGIVVDYTGIKASSGALSASGRARVAKRQIEAEFSVDLVEGVVGLPLQVNGPLENVKVSVPRGVVAGAALGTAVLPGVGTAIGARVGAALGKIFTPQRDRKNSTAPPSKPP